MSSIQINSEKSIIRKRKHNTTECNQQYLQHAEPAQKKQKVHHIPPSSSLPSLPSESERTTTNILNDDDLYFSDKDEQHSSDNDEDFDIDLDIDLNDTQNTYKTPLITKKLFNPLTTNTSNNPLSISPFNLKRYTPTNNHNKNSNLNINPSIYGISENSLSILYKYLSFNDILQMSKTCSYFWNESFKLLSYLTITCKNINGCCDGDKNLNKLVMRCSYYLKYLDLSHMACLVTDNTLLKISIHCTQLTNVSLHGCEHISDEYVILLLSKCQWLNKLDISGCYALTCGIGEALASNGTNMLCINMAWCTEIDSNIIPYLMYLNIAHNLRNVNLHCINKFITLFPAFKHVLDTYADSFKLQNTLFIIGGLQKKTMNGNNLMKHLSYLEAKGIHYTDPNTINLRSISEYDFKYKLNLLLKSKRISSNGYRLYTVNKTDKIYMVIATEYGVFGTKLLPGKDFNAPRDDYMALLQRSDRNPIEYLRSDCDLANWRWIDEFQSKRSLSLLGMNTSANWIQYTATKKCQQVNTFINTQTSASDKC